MTVPHPLVSIGMPVYNGEEFVRAAIDSLLAQDLTDFELIISDNASTDSTQQICTEYAAADPRVRYVRNETNIGAVANFDLVAELAAGRYFAWASHDDMWDPRYLSACVEPLENTDAILAYPQTRIIDQDGRQTRILYHQAITPTVGTADPVRRLNMVYQGGDFWALIYGLMHTAVVRKVLPMPRVKSNDTALVALLALQGGFAHVPEILFTLRDKVQREARYVSSEWMGPEIKRAGTYRSHWPTARAICRRSWRSALSFKQKLQVAGLTLKWCISEQNTISKPTRKRIMGVVRRFQRANG